MRAIGCGSCEARGGRSWRGVELRSCCVVGEHPAGFEVAVGPAQQQLGVLDLFRTRREHEPNGVPGVLPLHPVAAPSRDPAALRP